jgi:hypothetical protein
MNDWYITDVAGSGLVSPLVDHVDGSLSFNIDVIQSLNHDVYWMAPKQYIGNKVLLFPHAGLIKIQTWVRKVIDNLTNKNGRGLICLFGHLHDAA